MATVFYDHIIPWEKVEIYIREMGVHGEERIEILELIDETLHTEILIVILEHLPQHKHEEFVERFHAAPHHQDHLQFLEEHANSNVVERIRAVAHRVIDEVIEKTLK